MICQTTWFTFSAYIVFMFKCNEEQVPWIFLRLIILLFKGVSLLKLNNIDTWCKPIFQLHVKNVNFFFRNNWNIFLHQVYACLYYYKNSTLCFITSNYCITVTKQKHPAMYSVKYIFFLNNNLAGIFPEQNRLDIAFQMLRVFLAFYTNKTKMIKNRNNTEEHPTRC